MPAYRSAAEAEIRDAVVARLRQHRPGARIMHEINAYGFGNRIDVLCVDRAEIIAVEIKSKKDKIDRLPKQIKAMRGVAHTVIAAIHEKFLIPSRWGGEGTVDAPDEAKGATVWAYPEVGSRRNYGCAEWIFPPQTVASPLPADAIHMLWRDELYTLCGLLGLSVTRRSSMSYMVRLLRWHVTGRDLTLGICAALRRRDCIEADPVIEDAA